MSNLIVRLAKDPKSPESVLETVDWVTKYATLTIIAGILVDIIHPAIKYYLPYYDIYVSTFANVLIAVGLTAEFYCIEASSRATGAIKSKADIEVAAANLKANEAAENSFRISAELEMERSRRAPRILSDDQSRLITKNVIGKLDAITFVVVKGYEPRNFMYQLAGVFGQAGCRTTVVEMPAGVLAHYPAGVSMYKPGGARYEDEMKDDPLYVALKLAGLFGGFTAFPFVSSELGLDFSPPMLSDKEHIIYVGVKNID